MLPLLNDIQDVHRHIARATPLSDPHLAYLAAFLSREGLANRHIRAILGIEKVYALTHYKRVGLSLTDEEFQLWDKNPSRITLGHLRLLTGVTPLKREPILRSLIAQGLSVAKLAGKLKASSQDAISDIKHYANAMEESLGRGVAIRFDPRKQSGEITLKFYGLDDLERLSTLLGYLPADIDA